MTEPTIICPKCATTIPLTESIAAPLINETRKKFESSLVDKDREIVAREEVIRAERLALQAEKAAVENTVAERLKAERERIANEEAIKAKRNAAAELEAKSKELGELGEVLKERDLKLAEAQKAQADILRKERELDDSKRELELTVEKRVQASLGDVREKAKQEAEEGLKMRVLEKEEQISSMQRQIEELKRKAEQGSQQLQGEVLELELESLLRTKFPKDIIEPVRKGEFGGDVLQTVVGPGDRSCGVILWEFKQTKNWTDSWLAKLRGDQRAAKADMAVIVSNVLPKDVKTFGHVDGIWVTEAKCVAPVTMALRHSLIELSIARSATEGQQTKAALVYQYLTGPQFRQRIETIVEKFNEMNSDLDKERKAMTRMWAKREAQIRGVLESTSGMYGDLQGIAGKALGELEAFELPALEDQAERLV